MGGKSLLELMLPVLILFPLDKYSPGCRSEAHLGNLCIKYIIFTSAPIFFYISRNIFQMIAKCNLLKGNLSKMVSKYFAISKILRTTNVNKSCKNFVKSIRQFQTKTECTVLANNWARIILN